MKAPTFLGKTPGKIFHFIDIPAKTDKVTVICQTTKIGIYQIFLLLFGLEIAK